MNKFNCWIRASALYLLWLIVVLALSARTSTTVLGFTTSASPTNPPHLHRFYQLHAFDGADGLSSVAPLVQSTDGNLYGATFVGGANGGATTGGTIFKITPSGALTTIYNFCAQGGSNCTDGQQPYVGPVQGTDGNFYGTTSQGGANNNAYCTVNGTLGCGTVFKITPSGTRTTLYNFCSKRDCTDGNYPEAGLLLGADGNFYGTTSEGGVSFCNEGNSGVGCGTVFTITPGGILTTLLRFDGTDGISPGTLIQGSDGKFYGTTENGGAHSVGTVFTITPSGALTTLYNFCSQRNCMDGSNPSSYEALVQGTDGNFYGTTTDKGGDDSLHNGTVFKITPGGTLTTLFSWADGQGQPGTGLIQATDGKFYGTLSQGGAYGFGAIFSITPAGVLTTLHNFNGTDGSKPDAALVQDTNGNFYGTSLQGGANGDGTVFALSVGLGPFVKTQPTLGAVGTAVNILGTNLTGATSVTFNGTTAVFTVDSHALITTTVPTGATSGIVQVVTPSGTLSSNVPFLVRP